MTDITFDSDTSRYVLPLDGEEEAEVNVSRSHDVLTIRRVFVPASHEGQGLAARLMKHVADDVRAQGMKAVPVCSYADVWFHRNKDQQDLLLA